jgi:hypothetical protein
MITWQGILIIPSSSIKVHIIGKRYNEIYQHHIQNDQQQMEAHQTDVDRWKSIVQESMEQQVRRKVGLNTFS